MHRDPATPDLTRAVLLRVFPNPCRQVGTENLTDICAGHRDFDNEADAGFRLALGETLEQLANASAILTLAIELYVLKRDARKAPAVPADLDKAVLKAMPKAAKIPKKKRLELYLVLISLMDRDAGG
jgi:hypothetical protein